MDDDQTASDALETQKSETKTPETKEDILKYRLSIAGVFLALFLLTFMMFNDAIFNFQCAMWDFITFQCNRFDMKLKAWE